MHTHRKDVGFTLVELAIVLVIIGLIVGGVLVGQDLIQAATIRAGVSQIEQYDAAVNTFHGKFNGLPGDLYKAGSYFPALTHVTPAAYGAGDDDGVIDSFNSATGGKCTANTCISGEAALFWYELSQSGLIANKIDTVDGNKLDLVPANSNLPAFKLAKGSRLAVQGSNGHNYWIIGNFGDAALSAGSTTYTPAMTPADAFQLDTKFDDGNPVTGKTISIAPGTALADVPDTPGANACAVTTNGMTTYNAVVGSDTMEQLLCSISVRGSF